MTSKDMLKVGVVGSGIGEKHIEAYLTLPEKFELVAMCDIAQGKGEEIANKYSIPNFVSEFDQLCQMGDVDLIDICTPTHLHHPQSLQALAHGKHVICEKPVAGSLQAVDELIWADAKSDGRLMPIFQYRFGHGLQNLKNLVVEGIAGKAYLSTVETAWRRKADYYAVPWRGKWETELGGATLTLAVHAHDTLCYILGPIKSVFARTGTLVNSIETEDTVSVSLEMGDGSLANLAVTTGSVNEISRHRFCFENLSAESNTEAYNNTTDPWVFHGDTPQIEAEMESALQEFSPLPEYFAGQFYRFHEAIIQNGDLPVTLADARRSLELVTAIYFSARTGQSVELPLDNSHPYYSRWF